MGLSYWFFSLCFVLMITTRLRAQTMAQNNLKSKEREFIIECIQIYRSLPSLWNVKSKEYRDRAKKNASYKILLSKYKEMFPHATKEDVKKKFNSLRTNYRKELKKHLDSINSNADDIYQPTLWYFDEMFFLQEQESVSDLESNDDIQFIKCSPKIENECSDLDIDDTQNDVTTVRVYQAPSTSNAVPKIKNKNFKRKLRDRTIRSVVNNLRETPEDYTYWAWSLAADLKKMTPLQQIFAKKAMADVIMEGQLGLLHRNSIKINP